MPVVNILIEIFFMICVHIFFISLNAVSLMTLTHNCFGCRMKNSTSWVALNMAGLYWRVVGNANNAIECFRRAFYFSKSRAKDVSLIGLANVLHFGGHTIDAITLMQMAIQVGPKQALNHFTMAALLASLGDQGLEGALFFFETTLRLSKDFSLARDKMDAIRCLSQIDGTSTGTGGFEASRPI